MIDIAIMPYDNLVAVVFCVLLSFIRILSITGLSTTTTWQIKLELFDYEAYGSLQLTQFTVPTLAIRSTWLFSSYMSDNQCDMSTGFLSIQYGGFPLVTPKNETYPPFFHLHRSHQVTLNFPTDNSTLSYRLENPVAGNWYVVSALDHISTERIKQKGLGINCVFYLDIVHHIVSAEDVTVIASGTTTSGLAQHNQAGLFRFLTEGSTMKFTINISSCSCSGSTSCSTPDFCPIRVSSRSQAFPIPSRNGTHSVNCSTSSNCELEVEQPVIDDWQYVMVECLQPLNVTFNLTVDIEGCDWAYLSSTGTLSPRDHSGSPVDAMTTENPVFEREVSEGYVRTVSLRPHEADGSDLSVLNDVTERSPFGYEQVTVFPGQSSSFNADEHGAIKGTVNPSCLRVTDYGRFFEAMKIFDVTFRRRTGAYPLRNFFQMTDKEVVVAAFHIEPLVDSGGTLKLEANLLVTHLNDTSQIVVVELCLVKFRIPVSNGTLSCPLDSPRIEVSSETGKNNSAKVYIPYPESGVWFVAMAARCYSNVELSKRVLEQCQVAPITVNSTVSLSPCVDHSCASHGACMNYLSGVIHFSTCQCYYGYRGYGCTDDTEALSDAYQLMSILLLTLSNLFFIPSIVVSIYRRFYTEAFVYFFTMFISSFYHACDGHSKYTMCIMPFGVLSFCDFLVSIVAFWVTLVTMARLPLHWTSFSYVVAILSLAMGVEWDRHSLWTFLVPSVIAGLIMIIAFASRCWARRKIYPSKRRWLFFIVPGICLALLGLIIFAGLETDSNYQYTHSAWHACMALCIVFLLPPRPLRPIAKDDNLLSICVKGQDEESVVQITVHAEEQPPPPTDSAAYISSIDVSPNGGLTQKDNRLEVPTEEWQPPPTDPLLMYPSSVSSHEDIPLKDKGNIPLQDKGFIPLKDKGSIPQEVKGNIPQKDEGNSLVVAL